MSVLGWLFGKREKPICVRCRWYKVVRYGGVFAEDDHTCINPTYLRRAYLKNYITGKHRGYVFCSTFNKEGQCRHFERCTVEVGDDK